MSIHEQKRKQDEQIQSTQPTIDHADNDKQATKAQHKEDVAPLLAPSEQGSEALNDGDAPTVKMQVTKSAKSSASKNGRTRKKRKQQSAKERANGHNAPDQAAMAPSADDTTLVFHTSHIDASTEKDARMKTVEQEQLAPTPDQHITNQQENTDMANSTDTPVPDNSNPPGVPVFENTVANSIDEQPTLSLPKHESDLSKDNIADQPTVAIAKQENDTSKDAIADQPTAAIVKQESKPVEDSIADQPTAAMVKQESDPGKDDVATQKPVYKPVPVPVNHNDTVEFKPERNDHKRTNGYTKATGAVALVEPRTITKHEMPLPSVPGTGHSKVNLTEAEELALRRVRLNRLLMRKRRQTRGIKHIAPRIVTAFVVLCMLIITLFSATGGVAYAFYQSNVSTLDTISKRALFQTTHIYDRKGKLLYDLYDKQIGKGRRTYVNYANLPPALVNATIAIEDRSFWTNPGIDAQGIGRAVFSGGSAGGGSTITQQVIKNFLYVGQDRSYPVKLQEIILATGITATEQIPKWKIIEMYLNSSNYGNVNYGVEAAAQDYFGLKPKCEKDGKCKPAVSQLTVAQATLLAGLPQQPTYYNPVQNKDAALGRQQMVLDAMVETGKLTKVQADQAYEDMKKYKVESFTAKQQKSAPHFVDMVVEQLADLMGVENLANGGYTIRTSIDLDLQKKVEQITHDSLYKVQYDPYMGITSMLSRDKNVNNAAVVVMNPKTGEILAMNGSVDYNNKDKKVDGNFNAALSRRQPGSSFKPIIYATTFEMGWYPAMIIPDHKTVYPVLVKENPKEWYTPKNYDDKFRPNYPMTVRAALANSFNIPAVDALMFAGIPNVMNMAGRLGIPEIANTPLDQVGPSMALGGEEATLLNLTGAYATFANQGMRVPQVSILEVKDAEGEIIYQYDTKKPKGQQVIDPGIAFMMSSILSDKPARYLEFGPGNNLELPFPAAAKTGTTNDFRDNWTLGYTPEIAVGVWAGNSDNSEMYDVIGLTGAGPIWNQVMQFAKQHYNLPSTEFVPPDNVVRGTVSAKTGLEPRRGEGTVSDWFLKGIFPTITGSGNSYEECVTTDQGNGDQNNNQKDKKNNNKNNKNDKIVSCQKE